MNRYSAQKQFWKAKHGKQGTNPEEDLFKKLQVLFAGFYFKFNTDLDSITTQELFDLSREVSLLSWSMLHYAEAEMYLQRTYTSSSQSDRGIRVIQGFNAFFHVWRAQTAGYR